MPLRADSAWRRKLMTDTPGMVWGYWKARKTPALPRTSVSHSVMSSPLNRMRPCGDLVVGAAEQGVGEGGLARAVGPHQGVDLAGAHSEIDATQDLAPGPVPGRRPGPVPAHGPDVQVLDLEEGGGGHAGQCIRTTRVGEIPLRAAWATTRLLSRRLRRREVERRGVAALGALGAFGAGPLGPCVLSEGGYGRRRWASGSLLRAPSWPSSRRARSVSRTPLATSSTAASARRRACSSATGGCCRAWS